MAGPLRGGDVPRSACVIASGQQSARPLDPFTSEQANAGRATYQAKCAACHLPDLKGSNEAPPLAGGNFMNTWRDRAASDLFDRIHNTMPATNPGSLSDEEAAGIVAYILQTNGAAAGTQALTPATSAPIGAVANGQQPRQRRKRRRASSQIAQAPLAPARAAGAPAGLTVAGEVKNYVPVTDEMLLHPDPARLADGARKLSGLESQRAHANHPGQCERPQAGMGLGDERRRCANEPSPHRPQRNHVSGQYGQPGAGARCPHRRFDLGKSRPAGGDARRAGRAPRATSRSIRTRYFLATTDAHLAALDARTGKTVWDVIDRGQRQGLLEFERPDRDWRQSLAGAQRMRPLQGG